MHEKRQKIGMKMQNIAKKKNKKTPNSSANKRKEKKNSNTKTEKKAIHSVEWKSVSYVANIFSG